MCLFPQLFSRILSCKHFSLRLFELLHHAGDCKRRVRKKGKEEEEDKKDVKSRYSYYHRAGLARKVDGEDGKYIQFRAEAGNMQQLTIAIAIAITMNYNFKTGGGKSRLWL